jgi:hypothetical protein
MRNGHGQSKVSFNVAHWRLRDLVYAASLYPGNLGLVDAYLSPIRGHVTGPDNQMVAERRSQC